MGKRKKRFSGKLIPSGNIANTPFMVWWSKASRQETNNLSLAQITVEPLGVLLAAGPSPRCSAPFLSLDAPLVPWHLYGIESPGPSWPLDASWILDTLLATRPRTLLGNSWCSVPSCLLGTYHRFQLRGDLFFGDFL